MSEQPPPPREAAFFASIRQWGLVRGANGVVGGVVEGLGARIGLARVPARLIVVLAWLLLPGIVMLAYAAGWGLLPDQRGNIIIQNFGRGVTNVGALIGIAILTIAGFGGLNNGPVFGIFGWRGDPFMWDNIGFGGIVRLFAAFVGLAMIAGVVALIIWLVRRGKNPPHTADAPVIPAANGTNEGGTTADDNASSPVTPQPWEPALLPGDPRAGVPASAGAIPHSGTTSTHAPPPPHAPHAQGAWQGEATGASAVSPPPVYPAAPSVPGPGKAAYLSFLAVLLISAAIAAWLYRTEQLAVSPVLAWGAAITVGLGAILVIVALLGRRLGFLGFISVFAVILAVAFAGNADDIRGGDDNGPDRWSVARTFDREGHERSPRHDETRDEIEEEEFTEPLTTTDLTDDLAQSYSSVFIAGACMGPSQAASWAEVGSFGNSLATMRLASVDSDVELDLTAMYTRLTIPEGTNLEILGSGTTTVVWEERDVSCTMNLDGDSDTEFEGTEGPPTNSSTPVLSVTNPDAPMLTVNAGAQTTIYLEEVVR